MSGHFCVQDALFLFHPMLSRIDMEILLKAEKNHLQIGEFYTATIIGAEEFDLYAEIIK